jgi:pimeloyl-ACP methyl ester carboxylesterase
MIRFEEKIFKIRNGIEIAARAYKFSRSEPLSEPLLVFVHGWLDNASSFDDLIMDLDRPSIAIDLAGQGNSSYREPSADYHIWEYAFDLADLIENLNTKEVILIGHSLGTGILTLTAPLVRDKVKKLVFLDALGPASNPDHKFFTHFKKAYKEREKLQKALSDNSYEPNTYDSIEEATKVRMRSPIQKLDHYRAEKLITRNLEKNSDESYSIKVDPRTFLPSIIRLNETQINDLIKNIPQSVLAVFGKNGVIEKINSRGFEDIKREDIEKRIKSFPDLKTIWVEGDHYIHMPPYLKETSSHIKGFINE